MSQNIYIVITTFVYHTALPKPGVCPSVTVPPQIPTAEEAAQEGFNVFGECSEDLDCLDDLKCCGGAIKECAVPERK